MQVDQAMRMESEKQPTARGVGYALDVLGKRIDELSACVDKLGSALTPVLASVPVAEQMSATPASLDASTVTHRIEGACGLVEILSRQVMTLVEALDL